MITRRPPTPTRMSHQATNASAEATTVPPTCRRPWGSRVAHRTSRTETTDGGTQNASATNSLTTYQSPPVGTAEAPSTTGSLTSSSLCRATVLLSTSLGLSDSAGVVAVERHRSGQLADRDHASMAIPGQVALVAITFPVLATRCGSALAGRLRVSRYERPDAVTYVGHGRPDGGRNEADIPSG